jgi:LysR family transcriptional activator of mexEF-oprN operon
MINTARLDLTLATTFLAIWEERSVSKAARRMALSQSAVSAALARLRYVCADPLFTRSRSGMEPTPRAIQMAASMEQGVELLQGALLGGRSFAPATTTAHFSIGMSDDYEVAIGPAISRVLLKEAPGASIVLRQTNRHTAEKMLETREIDVAIAAGLSPKERIVAEPIGQSGYACLIDKTAASDALPLTLDSYLDLPHILVSFSGREGIVDTVLRPLGRQRSIHTALTHFSTLPHYLKGMRSIATLPAHAAQILSTGTGLSMLPVPIPLGTYAVAAYRRRDMASDPALSWLVSVIRNTFAKVIGDINENAAFAPSAAKRKRTQSPPGSGKKRRGAAKKRSGRRA